MKSLRRFRAFSLIELISTVAVIGTLAALLMPAINKAIKASHSGKCVANLKAIGTAFQLYENEHSYITPASFVKADEQSTGMWYQDGNPLNDYMSDNKISAIAICPGSRSNSPNAGIPRKGYPYFANYNIMIINATGQELMPKFKTNRASKLIRLMDTNKDNPDWGPGGNDLGEASRMGQHHAGGSNVLWLDNHISQVKLKDLKTENFRWAQDQGM